MKNHFHTIEPCLALKKYIACYYFIKSDDPNFSSRHYSFPHTYNALSIYKDSAFDSSPSKFNATPSTVPNYQMFIQVKKQAPLMVEISGRVNRVTILFKEFGINHFISEQLSAVMGYGITHFNSWKDDPLFPEFLASLFNSVNEIEKASVIDAFLLKRFSSVSFSYLPNAVAILCDFEKRIRIEEIAKNCEVSLRTFNRNFKEVLGVSPVEYRRIAQFRQSIEHVHFQAEFKRLTDIGYESHFYDQSYFNKIYQKLTGSSPKAFFRSIDKIGDDKLVFQFIKK